ncbi:MAG: hypothetical protein U0586_11045 [Candidatus Brocadiaceae bacterium]
MLAADFTDREKAQLKNFRIGALFAFIAVIMRFIVGDIIKPLVLFDVIQSGTPGHYRYEFHTPNLPDMCGDIVTIVLFGLAYMFMTSSRSKSAIRDIMYASCDMDNKYRDSVRQVRDYILQMRNIFYVAVIGFGMYFFSKYVFTTTLEVFFPEEAESEGLPFIFNILNSAVRLCASLAFVYAYCKYLGVHRHIKIMLYVFFFARNLLLTNILGLVHEHDVEIFAPLLDVLLPCILFYSVLNFISITKNNKELRRRFTQ